MRPHHGLLGAVVSGQFRYTCGTIVVATAGAGSTLARIFPEPCRNRAAPIDKGFHAPRRRNRPCYACLIYYDPQRLFNQSPEANAALAECEGYDEVLKVGGHFVTAEALELPDGAMTVSQRDGKVSTVDGPFMETKEILGGLVVIEARDLNDAVRAISGSSAGAHRIYRGTPRCGLQHRATGFVTMENTYSVLDVVYRRERGRVVTSIRLLGGFDAAEEALQEAFAAAVLQWPRDGIPANPAAWPISTGRFRTIDRWRRQARLAGALPDLALLADRDEETPMAEAIEDDELRLIFTCCHPSLPPDAQVALTLREVGGLTTEEIARAYRPARPPSRSGSCVRRRDSRRSCSLRSAGTSSRAARRA